MAEQFNSEDVVIRFVKEVTPGVTPLDDPGWKEVPFSVGSLVLEPTFVQDPTIRRHRQTNANIKTGLNPQGAITAPLISGVFDDWLAGGLAGDWNADLLKVSTPPVKTTFSIEQDMSSGLAADPYILFTGMEVASLDFTIEYGGLVSVVYNFQGMGGSVQSASAVGTGTSAAAPSEVPFDGGGGVTLWEVAGAASDSIAGSFNFSVAQGNEGVTGLGTEGRKAVRFGTAQTTGTVNFNTGDAAWTEFKKKLANQTSSLAITVTKNTKAYALSWNQVTWLEGQPSASGRGASVFMPLGMEANYNDGVGTSFSIARTP